MSANSTEMLSSEEIAFLLLSLDAFESRIKEFKQFTSDHRNKATVDLNLGFISSVKQNLVDRKHNFSLNEMKVMYAAVDDRRDFINASLDEGFDNEDDHFVAMASLRLANSIIRKIKASFQSLGIDIKSFISNGGNA